MCWFSANSTIMCGIHKPLDVARCLIFLCVFGEFYLIERQSIVTAGYIGFVWKAREIAVCLPLRDIGFVTSFDQHNFIKQ